MSPKIYQNLSGTTKDSFKIGKKGPEIIRGYGFPGDDDYVSENPLIADSSLFMDQSSGNIYIKRNHRWILLNKDYDTYNYFTFLAQQETIRNVIDIVYAEKREKYQPISPVTFIIITWLIITTIIGGIFLFLLTTN